MDHHHIHRGGRVTQVGFATIFEIRANDDRGKKIIENEWKITTTCSWGTDDVRLTLGLTVKPYAEYIL